MKNCEEHTNVESPGLCPICLIEERDRLQEALEFNPRACKLAMLHKLFIVISVSETYFAKAFALIRQQEQEQDTWTDEDETWYEATLDLNRQILAREKDKQR